MAEDLYSFTFDDNDKTYTVTCDGQQTDGQYHYDVYKGKRKYGTFNTTFYAGGLNMPPNFAEQLTKLAKEVIK